MVNVELRVKQLVLNHVFNVVNNISPTYMYSNFQRVSDVHSHNTRSSLFNFAVPISNSSTQQTFYYNGIKIWNTLPNDIKAMPDKHSFKLKVKSYLSFQ